MTFEAVLAQARAEGRTLLNEVEAKQLLRDAGVPVTNTTLATSRAEAQTMRLATLYAVLDRSATICEPHLKAALAVWRYAEQSARYAFGEGTGDALADKLLGILGCSPVGLSRTQIRDQISRGRPSREVEAALHHLETLGLAVRHQVETATRPAEYWRVM